MNDLISRQAAIDAYGDWYVEEETEEGFIGTVKQLLEGFPSAQPEIITGTVRTGKGENMTLDEAIDKIDEDLHRLDLEDIHGRESREAINYLETMRRWIKDAKERYAK